MPNNWFVSLTPAAVPGTVQVHAGDTITFVNPSSQGITLSNLPGGLSPAPPTSQIIPVGGGTISYNVNQSSTGGNYTWAQGLSTGLGSIRILSAGASPSVITITGANATISGLPIQPGSKVSWKNGNSFQITITLPQCVSPSDPATIKVDPSPTSSPTFTINAQASSNSYSWQPTTSSETDQEPDDTDEVTAGTGQGTIDVS